MTTAAATASTVRRTFYDVIVAGAGITGLASARELARSGLSVCVVDPNPPMTGTSAYSTECYRDVWAHHEMSRLCRRSISLLEELAQQNDDRFGFMANQHGYLFVSDEPFRPDCSHSLLTLATDISQHGGGPLRHHGEVSISNSISFDDRPHHSTKDAVNETLHGFDILWGEETIARSFPHVRAQSALHARRAGWIDAQQLGTVLMEDLMDAGGDILIGGQVTGVSVNATTKSLDGVEVRLQRREEGSDNVNPALQGAWKDNVGVFLCTQHLVNAAGPFAGELHNTILKTSGVSTMSKSPPSHHHNSTIPSNLCLRNELHAKVVFKDHHGIIPPDSPMIIMSDKTALQWGVDEMEWVDGLRQSPEKAEESGIQKWIQPGLPPGCHIRPASNGWCIMLWEHAHQHVSLAQSALRVEDGSTNSGRYDPSMPLFYDTHVQPNFDQMYPEIAMRAMSSVVPELFEYVGKLGRRDATIDGGYYTYSPDQLPIVGAIDEIHGYHVATGMAGFGIMAALGVGELITESVHTSKSPMSAFCPSRLPYIEAHRVHASVGGAL